MSQFCPMFLPLASTSFQPVRIRSHKDLSVAFEECWMSVFLLFWYTHDLLYSCYLLTCPKESWKVRIQTLPTLRLCVCVPSAGRAALSHHNVVSLTVSPSLTLWVRQTALSSTIHQINKRFREALKSYHVPDWK